MKTALVHVPASYTLIMEITIVPMVVPFVGILINTRAPANLSTTVDAMAATTIISKVSWNANRPVHHNRQAIITTDP